MGIGFAEDLLVCVALGIDMVQAKPKPKLTVNLHPG
jgi:queuine/archaeosine tRNA-ribosyltransferase